MASSNAVAVLGKNGKVIVWVAHQKELTYYQYFDEGFHHTVCLLDSIPNLQIIHTAALQTPKKKEIALLEKFEDTLQCALIEKDDEAAEEEQRPRESLIQSHGTIAGVSVQSIQPIVKGFLSTESAYLHFCGNADYQHEPTLCVGLKLLLEQDCMPSASCETIGPGTLLQSFLQIDATAADALLMWPPANAAQQFQTGGHASTNSIYGLLASSCCTSAGKHLLKRWLRQPLVNAQDIAARHDTVEYWLEQSVTRDAVRLSGLKPMGTSDMNKLATVLGTPNLPTRKSLAALFDLYLVAWQKLPGVVEHLNTCDNLPDLAAALYETLTKALEQLQPAIQLVEAVLDMDEAPREFLVQVDYKDELKDVHSELQAVKEDIENCQNAMNEEWGKLSGSANNQVRLEETNDGGLQFRLPNTNDSKILQQTSHITVHRLLKNGVYFSTTELNELCSKRQDLRNEYDRLQAEIVSDAIEVAATYAPVLEEAAAALASLDVLTALAHTAAHHQYCRPDMLDTDQPVLELVGARHPCVELQEHVDFIPNDCSLGENGAFLLVTGPNMGGKSTYLRSLGSIALLAQIGSFVPCTSAKINICHHILARIGAGDWQERGISTFMAEMLESSRILKTATRRSLILIDELGRGTSTYDGYGLARAISEYIMNKIGCITIFVSKVKFTSPFSDHIMLQTTHFHELTSLPGAKNCHVTAQTDNGALTFLYTVQPGPCLQSFGIAVAEMANVPASVIEDAKQRARALEKFDIIERFRRLPKEALTKDYGSNEKKKEAILSMLTA